MVSNRPDAEVPGALGASLLGTVPVMGDIEYFRPELVRTALRVAQLAIERKRDAMKDAQGVPAERYVGMALAAEEITRLMTLFESRVTGYDPGMVDPSTVMDMFGEVFAPSAEETLHQNPDRLES